VLLIETDDVRYALAVDQILRTEDVAVKPLGRPLDRIPGVVGAAVLGNGEVTPVLDVAHFAKGRSNAVAACPPPDEPV
jgi:chemosensory pili system protein ChpA (sensor histidine kinase/response regulator)